MLSYEPLLFYVFSDSKLFKLEATWMYASFEIVSQVFI